MKNKYWFHVLVLGLCIASVAFIYGCGSAASSGGGGGGATISNRAGTYQYSGTQSPGDVWTWVISTTEFSGSNETTGFWVTGEWVTLVSGFSKATVIDSSDITARSTHAYFLEFPGTMLLVKPGGDSSKVMVCAAAATVEPNEGRYLFVNIPESGWSAVNSPSYGTVEAINNGFGSWEFTVTSYSLEGGVFQNSASEDFVWSNGSFTMQHPTSSHTTEIFMTPSGIFFGDAGPDRGGFAGASKEALTASQLFSTVFVLNRTFKGVRFIYDPINGTGETEPITCTKDSTRDALLASSYTNVETGTQPGPGVFITFEAFGTSGFFTGYATQISTFAAGTETFRSSASLIGPAGNQKYMLYGIGRTQDGTDRPWNFLIIQTSD